MKKLLKAFLLLNLLEKWVNIIRGQFPATQVFEVLSKSSKRLINQFRGKISIEEIIRKVMDHGEETRNAFKN